MTNNTPDYNDNLYFEEKKMDCKNCPYTDEYCASGDCERDNNLTEQWKKGKLPEGDYFISNGDEIYPDYYDSAEGFFKTYDYGVRRVLAEVPDYVEWKQLKEYERIVTSYNMKPIDYDIACETVNKLLDDNKRLKHNVGNLGYKIKNQRHEIERQIAQNAQLKDLLKECELWFTGIVGNMNDKNVGEHNRSVPLGNFEYIFKEFSQKIDEVLKCGNIK